MHPDVEMLWLEGFLGRLVILRLAAEVSRQQPDPQAWTRQFIDGLHADVEKLTPPDVSLRDREHLATCMDNLGSQLLAMCRNPRAP